jgi:hypothetical protein
LTRREMERGGRLIWYGHGRQRVIQEQSKIVWTNLAHEETPEDDTVELGVGPASEEAVKL